ncbi:hypothetical protein Ndes2526B_g06945 [Nannochloris sp. 'desiccata']|nr:hypothetical protein KSW81_004971 [Chlorella desiccata (nom. nud.)]KAH7618045.1 hypothetical protein NADE_000246 [Chlorella desiccata (nom. nud.)]
MKRKREDDKPDVDPPIIKVEYTNLPTESRHKLDSLLHEWKNWHADRFPEGFRPPEVLSGTLRYEPNGALSSLPESTLPVLDDRPAPSINPITRTMWFNVQYERTGEVPTYERAVNRPLKIKQQPQPLVTTSSFLPNGNDKPSEGGIVAEPDISNSIVAFPGIAGSDRAFISAAGGNGGGGSGGGGQGSKRQRIGQRCFNCGSYAHSLRECWKEHDPEAIEDARRRLQGVSGAGGNSRPPKRYFLIEEKMKDRKKERQQADKDGKNDEALSSSESEEEDGALEESLDEEELTPFELLQREFPLATPGLLSTSLREAMGIGALDAPPWLHAMRAMGIPPAYKPRPAAKTVDIAEKEKEEMPPPPPPPPPPPLEQEGQGEEVLILPVIEDKLGVSTAIAINLAAAQGLDKEADDFIQLPKEDDSESDKEEEEEADRVGNIYREEVKFPGINAPIPEGADPIQWGGGGGGGGHVPERQHAPSPSQQQQPLQNPVPMYSAVASHNYYAQHSYHQQEWHQQQNREYYPPPSASAAAAAAAAAYYHHGHDYGHHQHQQAPPPEVSYYHPPPPESSSVLPYQPPPPPTQQPPQFSSAPPPPPPPSDAGHWR